MTLNALAAVRRELDKCVKCAACQAGCPTYETTRRETMSARGKLQLAQALLDGRLTFSSRVENDFAQCLSCMSCAEVCPSEVDTLKIFTAARAGGFIARGGAVKRFIFRHVLPYPARLGALAKFVGLAAVLYQKAPAWLARFLPFVSHGARRLTPDLLSGNLRKMAGEVNDPLRPRANGAVRTVAYFSGCMTDLAYAQTGREIIARLNDAGVKVIFPKAQVCCGAPAYFAGDMESFGRLARANMDLLARLDVDAVVYSCATCGSVLGHVYAKSYPNDPRARALTEKVVDAQQLFVELALEKILRERPGKKLRVTWHDPCHLRRGLGVKNAPRELIKSLPRVEFVEMEGADRCCGGAGAFSLAYYGMAVELGAFKAEAIRASGADAVVTACPSCQLQLADSLRRAGLEHIPVLHTADLIRLVAD